VSWRAYIEGTLTDLVVGRMFFCPAAPFFRNQLLSYENIRLTELLSSCSRACPFLSLETTPRLLVSSYPPNTHTPGGGLSTLAAFARTRAHAALAGPGVSDTCPLPRPSPVH
jgi:hypothetical protein